MLENFLFANRYVSITTDLISSIQKKLLVVDNKGLTQLKHHHISVPVVGLLTFRNLQNVLFTLFFFVAFQTHNFGNKID